MKRWLSRYLSVLTLIPVAGLLLFIANDMYRAYHSFEQANETIANARLVKMTSSLVHELQKERGISAGYIGSNGKRFATELRSQRTSTNNSAQQLTGFLQDTNYHENTKSVIQQLRQKLGQLSNVRRQIDALDIPLAKALGYYSGNNTVILDLNGNLASRTEEANSARRFLTLYNLAYAKEQAGVERAVLNGVFASGAFTPELYLQFITLVTKQDTYLKSTYNVANVTNKLVLDQFNQSQETRKVEQFRDLAKNSDNGLNVDANAWFSAATARINKLKSTEDALLDEVMLYSSEMVNSRRMIILFQLVLFLLVLTLGYGVFSTINLRARQSNEINRVMRKVDGEKDFTDPVEVFTEDELGKIAELINLTFKNIRLDFISFQKNAQEIGEATLQAASATDQSKANLNQLQMNISSIASATEEMSVSITSVMENMQVASNGAENAAKETLNGEEAVKISMRGIAETADEVAKVGNTITELNGRVNDILGMVDVIKSVAEQTNLLALNAAIEAARAGEQGRGFAVVADEVRSLAQRTQQSTQEISNVVDVLKSSSQNAFASIESGNQQAREAVVNAEKISEVLTKIVDNIKSVDDVTRVIASSTQEQSSVIQSINSNVANIDDQARENVVGAEQLSAASLVLSEIAKSMEKRIQAYKV
jgi:methyl-accepting chemotaxis protein